MAVPPNLLIFEPNDIAFSMDESDFFRGLSEKRDEDDLSEIEMSLPSECDIDDLHLDMETVELSPEMKHDETRVSLYGNSVHAASHGKRNFRYYKKLMQGALTSRKRLSKEYKHIIIQFVWGHRIRIEPPLSSSLYTLSHKHICSCRDNTVV